MFGRVRVTFHSPHSIAILSTSRETNRGSKCSDNAITGHEIGDRVAKELTSDIFSRKISSRPRATC